MAVIRPEWAIANPLNTGPELYAPPDRRSPDEQTNPPRVAVVRPQVTEGGPLEDRSAVNFDTLIRRVAGAAVDEIDSVIQELEVVRQILRNESERVSREVALYVGLNQASIAAMRTIANNIKKWKGSDKSD